ncbi:WD40 repeat domain-containing protein [Thalassoglobus polymorphus]|uniref:WD domain, G-beta repeat n=1 Tax=Thalassoglobus polymorphus TaxID=2527994 RepID=A0A517QN52_9PLAN|nr:hypothetical protein [Thalassoglobus polymorphus]QDT33035.1 hypothetical protein Mal48_22870 [Thalassoglobus polymorphus]
MPITVECSECGARNRYPDHMAGKTGRCKTCRERIQIRRRKGSGKRKKKKSSSNGLLIGIFAALFVLILGGGAIFFLGSGEGEIDPNIATDENRPLDDNAPNSLEEPTGNANVGENKQPDSQTVSNVTQPAKESSSPSKSPSGFTPPSATETAQAEAEGLTLNRSANWSVTPDPGENTVEYEQGKPLRIKLEKNGLRGSAFLVPVAPSPYVAVHSGTYGKYHYSVYDVTTGKELAEIPTKGAPPVAALSDDGSYLAMATSGSKTIEVMDLKAKKSLGSLTVAEANKFNILSLAIWKHRLVAISNVHKGIKVWDLPSGKLVHEISGGKNFNPSYGHAFSPGGKYVAIDGDFLKKRIDIYDLDNGAVVGSIEPQGKTKVHELEALGFSSDGTQFSAIYGVHIYSGGTQKYSRMLVWDLPTGKVSADFEISPILKDQLNPVYQSRTLESFQDGRRWLVHSLGIVDTEAKQLVYSFPKQAGVDFVPSRKIMGPTWILSVLTDKGDPQLDATTFTEEVLLAGAASAAAGGFTSDAELPPLTAVDLTKAQEGIAVEQWSAVPDPLQSAAIPASIKITTSGTVRDIALARGANAVVAVRAGIKEDLDDPLITSYESTRSIYESRGLTYEKPQPLAESSELIAFDASGDEAAKLNIPFSAKLRCISPDGKFAIVEQHRTNGRLDLYELQNDGSHIVGWRPFRDATDKGHREIKRVEFIDSDHVATLSKNYQFVVWSLPDLQPVWSLKEASDFAISPGGKQLAIVRGSILGASDLAMFESRTGQGLGISPLEGALASIAYHPNGESLAIGLDTKANKTVRIYNTATGEAEEIPIPDRPHSLAWTGKDYLLVNSSQLLSRPLQAVVWSYDTKNIILPGFQTTEQLCFAQVPNTRALVRTVEVPNSGIESKLDSDRLNEKAILKPGDSVSLDVQIGNDALLAPLKSTAKDLVAKQLEAAESKVAENANISLTAELSLKSEGTANLSKIGDRTVSETVTRKSVSIVFSYRSGGTTVWSTISRVGNLDQYLVRLKPGQSAQTAIDELMLEGVNRRLANTKLPRYIFGADAGKGLGTSTFFE